MVPTVPVFDMTNDLTIPSKSLPVASWYATRNAKGPVPKLVWSRAGSITLEPNDAPILVLVIVVPFVEPSVAARIEAEPVGAGLTDTSADISGSDVSGPRFVSWFRIKLNSIL